MSPAVDLSHASRCVPGRLPLIRPGTHREATCGRSMFRFRTRPGTGNFPLWEVLPSARRRQGHATGSDTSTVLADVLPCKEMPARAKFPSLVKRKRPGRDHQRTPPGWNQIPGDLEKALLFPETRLRPRLYSLTNQGNDPAAWCPQAAPNDSSTAVDRNDGGSPRTTTCQMAEAEARE